MNNRNLTQNLGSTQLKSNIQSQTQQISLSLGKQDQIKTQSAPRVQSNNHQQNQLHHQLASNSSNHKSISKKTLGRNIGSSNINMVGLLAAEDQQPINEGSAGGSSQQINFNQSGKFKDFHSNNSKSATSSQNNNTITNNNYNIINSNISRTKTTGINIYEKQSSQPKQNQNEQFQLNTNSSITSLTPVQARIVNNNNNSNNNKNLYNSKYNPKLKKSHQDQQQKNNVKQIQRSKLGLISSTGGNSFKKINKNQSQNQHISYQSISTSNNNYDAINNPQIIQQATIQAKNYNNNNNNSQNNKRKMLQTIQSSNQSDVVCNNNQENDQYPPTITSQNQQELNLRKSPTASQLLIKNTQNSNYQIWQPNQQQNLLQFQDQQQKLNRKPSMGTLGGSTNTQIHTQQLPLSLTQSLQKSQKNRNQVQNHRPASSRPQNNNLSNLGASNNRTLNNLISNNNNNQLQNSSLSGQGTTNNLQLQQQQIQHKTPLSAEKRKVKTINRYNNTNLNTLNSFQASQPIAQSHSYIDQPLQAQNMMLMVQSLDQGCANQHQQQSSNNLSMNSTSQNQINNCSSSGTGEGKILSKNSTQRGAFGTGSNFGQSQKLKMLKIISQQQNSINFSKTLRSYQGDKSGSTQLQLQFHNNLGSGSSNLQQEIDDLDYNEEECIVSEEDIYQKEEQLSIIHKELKNKSIEILTDQLMLKDKEIATLKKQLEIMRNQILQQQTQNNSSQQNQTDSSQREQQNYENNNQKNYYQNQMQSIEEERKSMDHNNQHQQRDLSSFDDSSLQVIQQIENPYHPNLDSYQDEVQQSYQTQKQLQRSDGRQLGSHQNLPVRGLVRSGSSQLNNKLGKMKSTADLFSGIRDKINEGESVQDFLNRYQPKEAPNLEDIIKESMIEASQSQSIIQNQMMLNGDDEGGESQVMLNCDDNNNNNQIFKGQMLFEKSMSIQQQQLDNNNEDLQSNRVIDELFSNRPTNFDPQELERLVDYSQDEERQQVSQNNQRIQQQSKQKATFNEREIVFPTGMNDQSSILQQQKVDQQDAINYYDDQKQIQQNHEFSPVMNLQSHNSSENFMLFEGNNRLLYEQKIFNDSPSERGNNLGESQQVIMRNDDSFISKQTNDYLKDLYEKHQIGIENIPNEKRFSETYNSQKLQGINSNKNLQTQNQNQFWDESPAYSSKSSASSNDTARLSFSKEEKLDSNNNPIATQLSNDKRRFASPPNNFILQTQSINSIGDLLKEAQSPSHRFQNPPNLLTQLSNNSAAAQNSQINQIKALNLQTKKSIEFNSPPSSNMKNTLKMQSQNPQIINPNLSEPQSLQSSAITDNIINQSSQKFSQQAQKQSNVKNQSKFAQSQVQQNVNTNTTNNTGIGMNRQKSTGKLMTIGNSTNNQGNNTNSSSGMIMENKSRKLIEHMNKQQQNQIK